MRKVVVNLGLVLLSVFGIVASLKALPPGNISFDDVYYTDDTLTTYAGERYMGCNEGMYRDGDITPYVIRQTFQCESPYNTSCGRYECLGGLWYDPIWGEYFYTGCSYRGPC